MICLTFDLQDCPEPLIQHALGLCDRVPGKLTFFCSHKSALLGDRSPRWEVALLPCVEPGEDPAAAVKRVAAELPMAAGLRAAGFLHGERVMEALSSCGLRYASNTTPLYQSPLAPYALPWGGYELPVFYVDTLDFLHAEHWPGSTPAFDPTLLHRASKPGSLYIFDFHPVHLLLNTPNLAFYLANKAQVAGLVTSPLSPFLGRGTRTFFLELVETLRESNSSSFSMCEALDFYAARLPTGVWEGKARA
ncbi:MAG: hypothetical protein HYZ53_22890 [Planctomycetes bacterium]|nr:hypothetical protein [Planctomycetota bacterium]